jgi:catechol 2,3-dioxygenase-like lactoylglutathione lyase family enzyme
VPKLDGILETAIHTEDMTRSRTFYEGVLGLESMYSDDRLTAYAVAGRDVLLVFRKGTTGPGAVTLAAARSAYSRPGGASPKYYPKDISKAEVEAYRASHH